MQSFPTNWEWWTAFCKFANAVVVEMFLLSLISSELKCIHFVVFKVSSVLFMAVFGELMIQCCYMKNGSTSASPQTNVVT